MNIEFGRPRPGQKPPPDPLRPIIQAAQLKLTKDGVNNLTPNELTLVMHDWSVTRIVDGLDHKARKRQSSVILRLSPWVALVTILTIVDVIASL